MAADDRVIAAAIVVAAGSGSRLGAGVPKAFVRVGGRTLLEHARDGLLAHAGIGAAVVVAPPQWLDAAAEQTGCRVVAGGATRQQSVSAGLAALDAVDGAVDVVLVHDVARPFVPASVIDRVLAALAAGADAAIPACPVTDTIKQVGADAVVTATLDRARLVAVQTPQGFRRAVLVAAHAAGTGLSVTDDAALVEAAGGRVVAVPGAREAFKITDAWDLATAEHLAGSRR
jgi:2-C-methyl-D-erythritol 4-phosphate cytidylyltransferase